jgi:hypothetical protein
MMSTVKQRSIYVIAALVIVTGIVAWAERDRLALFNIHPTA